MPEKSAKIFFRINAEIIDKKLTEQPTKLAAIQIGSFRRTNDGPYIKHLTFLEAAWFPTLPSNFPRLNHQTKKITIWNRDHTQDPYNTKIQYPNFTEQGIEKLFLFGSRPFS